MKKFRVSLFGALLSVVCLQAAGRMPVSLSEALDQVAAQPDRESQQKAWQEWLQAHPEKIIPCLDKGQVYFIYADMNQPERSLSAVEVEIYKGSRLSSTLPLKPWKNSIIYTVQVPWPQPGDMGYQYQVYRDGKRRKAIDPLNHAINLRAGKKAAVIDPDSSQGTLLMLDAPRSSQGLKKRDAWVYLPPGYFKETNRSYPVLYLQDGQNLWDHASLPFGGWKIDTTADRLIQEGKIQPFIAVGIENSADRAFEYVGFSILYQMDKDAFVKNYPQFQTQVQSGPSLAEHYLEYLVGQVIPWAESAWRIKKEKAYRYIGGSSFGAGVSLHTGFRYPELFSGIISLSGGNYPMEEIGPHYLKPFNVFPYLIDKLLPRPNEFKIYLHCGDQDLDAQFVKLTRKMHSALLRKGWTEGSNLKYVIDSGKGHNEKTWAQRMPEVLEFMLGSE